LCIIWACIVKVKSVTPYLNVIDSTCHICYPRIMKFVKNMFEHAHGPFKLNGTFNIPISTFHLFLHFLCCSFEPLSITTCNGILELPTSIQYIESWDEIRSFMKSKLYNVMCTCDYTHFVIS